MSERNFNRQLEDIEFIRHAVEYGVLEPVDVWHHDPEAGDPAIVIACGDMHQVQDRLHHCLEAVTPTPQCLFTNGAGIRLDALSPANHDFNFVPSIIRQIEEAIELKEAQLNADRPSDVKPARIKRLVLYVDSDCGIARKYGLSIVQSCTSAIYGKVFLKERFPDREVALKFYLDRPADVLGRDHRLVVEHPNARALTFHFSSRTMLDFFDIFREDQAATFAR